MTPFYFCSGNRLSREKPQEAKAADRVVRIARDLNREIATPVQDREMMGLANTQPVSVDRNTGRLQDH